MGKLFYAGIGMFAAIIATFTVLIAMALPSSAVSPVDRVTAIAPVTAVTTASSTFRTCHTSYYNSTTSFEFCATQERFSDGSSHLLTASVRQIQGRSMDALISERDERGPSVLRSYNQATLSNIATINGFPGAVPFGYHWIHFEASPYKTANNVVYWMELG